jgi:hypothetical protein
MALTLIVVARHLPLPYQKSILKGSLFHERLASTLDLAMQRVHNWKTFVGFALKLEILKARGSCPP